MHSLGVYGVNMQKWSEMTIFEQMGNIGSEVGRAFSAIRRGDETSADAALYRGLDLFDATSEVWSARQSPKTKEIVRAREVFAQAVSDRTSDESLEEYFMQYAMAARAAR